MEKEKEEEEYIIIAISRIKRRGKRSKSATINLLATDRARDFGEHYGTVVQGCTGLMNLGNSCYMNAIMQCLSHVDSIKTYILSKLYLHRRKKATAKQGFIVYEFAEVIKHLWTGEFKYIKIHDFYDTIVHFNESFSNRTQQDGHEMLLYLLNALHEGLNTVTTKVDIAQEDNEGKSDSEAADITWRNHALNNSSFIHDNFVGQFKSVIQCQKCQHRSVKFDQFMFLSIPLKKGSTSNLDECLDGFLEKELLDGDSRWNCPKCQSKQEATKQMAIWRLPKILIIQLVRFKQVGRRGTKIDYQVMYPELLDMKRCCQGPCEQSEYEVTSILNQRGNLEGGHYTSYCKHNHTWYSYDDTKVTKINDIQSKHAYILFYTLMVE